MDDIRVVYSQVKPSAFSHRVGFQGGGVRASLKVIDRNDLLYELIEQLCGCAVHPLKHLKEGPIVSHCGSLTRAY